MFYVFYTVMTIRSNNYTSYERELLIGIISEHRDVVKIKKTDNRSNRDKESAWATITNKFNADEHTRNRTSKQLKGCWKNLKTRAKKQKKHCEAGHFPHRGWLCCTESNF